MNEELRELLLSAPTDRYSASVLVINHTSFPEPFYITDTYPGFMANWEGQLRDFLYVPMKVGLANIVGDLNYERKVTIQDLNEIIRPILKLIPIDNNLDVTCDIGSYVIYEDGTVSEIQEGPFNLFIQSTANTTRGVAFNATAEQRVGVGSGVLGDLNAVPFYEQYV